MKNIINILAILLFISASFFSCNSVNNDVKKEKTSITKKQKNSSDTLVLDISEKKNYKKFHFICPQGDKKGNSDKEGTCPTCEMELIENPDYTNNK